MRMRIIGCALLLGLSLPGVSWAQATGRIAGAVTSDDGRPVPNAQISVQGTRLGARSDSSGHYRIDVAGTRRAARTASATTDRVGSLDKRAGRVSRFVTCLRVQS